MKKNITCPVRGTLAAVQYELDPETAAILGATACTLMKGGDLYCEQECIALMRIRQQELLARGPPVEKQ